MHGSTETRPTETRVGYVAGDGVATITINRPEAKNALTKSMYAAIRDNCIRANADADVSVIVIEGSSGSFATGGDLKEILEVLESDEPTRILDYEEYLPFETVRSSAKPVIARVDGLCIGGGLTLALMCDIIIASDASRFAIPEAKVGIVDGHLPRLLRDQVSPAKLRYWMYTGVIFPAAEALDAGLLTMVVPVDQLDAAVSKCVGQVKASSAYAITACKKILNETRTLSPMTDANLAMLQPGVLPRLQAFRSK